ncbi:hypothetical protein [Weissella oryzae]|nr:hypothetical protein [Weissella oryzae]
MWIVYLLILLVVLLAFARGLLGLLVNLCMLVFGILMRFWPLTLFILAGIIFGFGHIIITILLGILLLIGVAIWRIRSYHKKLVQRQYFYNRGYDESEHRERRDVTPK